MMGSETKHIYMWIMRRSSLNELIDMRWQDTIYWRYSAGAMRYEWTPVQYKRMHQYTVSPYLGRDNRVCKCLMALGLRSRIIIRLSCGLSNDGEDGEVIERIYR